MIVEPGDRVLAPFHPKLSARAARTLARLGVELVFGQGRDRHRREGRPTRRRFQRAVPTLVWTRGGEGEFARRRARRRLGDGTLTRGGRVVVTPELTVPGHPEIAVVGDLYASPDGSGGGAAAAAPGGDPGRAAGGRQPDRRAGRASR